MKCIYHSADLDGKCSAAIVKGKFPYCELIPYDYGKEFPWYKFTNKGEEVFMVDISLPVKSENGNDMIHLADSCTLTWIDHHISSINEAIENNFDPNGLRRIGEAACELVWQYLYQSTIPKAVKYLGRYDVWDHSDPNAMIFQNGMKTRDARPTNSDFWNSLFFPTSSSEVDKILRDGILITNFLENENRIYSGGFAFETELEGYKVIAINKGMANSQLFDHVWNPNKHDIMIAFCMRKNGTKWKVSLYTTEDKNVDVSLICKKYGGGGHQKAAGFVCNELPFNWIGKESQLTEA
jgi:oligoribonuclease NrnB/cAMP/cGMP phosphodiesterase (DHH superfamily)